MEQVTAQVSKHVDAPPAEVWKALTDPAKLKRFFFGANVESGWKPGDPIRMRGEFKGKAFEDSGEVRSFEPERKLAYTHVSSADPSKTEHLVTFELAPKGDGTEVTVTQAKTGGGSEDEKQLAEYEKNWAMMLESLEKAVAN